ncbi:MAG: AraC family transcriptional regulator ligand-binding domain-containing protein [Pseudomonadota bacterium]
MKALEQSLPARYFAQLIDFLESRGTPCRDALSAAQIRSLNDAQARLTISQVDALLAELERLTGRGDMGFELGKLIKLNSHDVLGYAMISSATLDNMLRLVSRYYRLMSPLFTFRYDRRGNEADLAFIPLCGMPERVLHFHTEVVALSFQTQISAVAQGQMSCDYMLSMPAPRHLARYREVPQARFQFGDDLLPGVRIKMRCDRFDTPLAMTDTRALQQAEARCKLMLQEVAAAGKWSDWVRMMLNEAEDCQPTLDELASILNISARTLDRYLGNEGASFRDLGVSIRNERARQMLLEGKFAISQIAYRLGYTDIANFSRSFKKLNGVSPSTFQEQDGMIDTA